MAAAALPRKLWEHPNPKGTQLWGFMELINKKYNLDLTVRVSTSVLPHET
jgi:acetoacetyl-CoA synthetase